MGVFAADSLDLSFDNQLPGGSMFQRYSQAFSFCSISNMGYHNKKVGGNLLLYLVAVHCFFVATPMKLLMYIENDLIDSITIEADKIIHPGYIGEFIKMFRERHALIIQRSLKEPEFLVQKISGTSRNRH